jgi:OOP family OmpA-OmpF porin
VLEPGCDQKLKNLTSALVDAKKQLDSGGVKNYKFEVSGHTDSSGDAAKNRALSEKRAAVIVKELVARGIAKDEIIAVGRGSEALRDPGPALSGRAADPYHPRSSISRWIRWSSRVSALGP